MSNKRYVSAAPRWVFGLILALAMLLTIPASADATSGYKKGFFISAEDGSSTLKINGRVQARFNYEGLEGIDNGADDEYQFSVPRARLTMGGHLWSKDLKYKFQTDFGKGGAALKDFYVDFKLMDDWIYFRTGQWKRPFSRQQLNSSARLEFVERALTDKAFGAGRDIGIALHSNAKNDGFEYTVGLFNGTGDKGKFSGSANVDLDCREQRGRAGSPTAASHTAWCRPSYTSGRRCFHGLRSRIRRRWGQWA